MLCRCETYRLVYGIPGSGRINKLSPTVLFVVVFSCFSCNPLGRFRVFRVLSFLEAGRSRPKPKTISCGMGLFVVRLLFTWRFRRIAERVGREG